MSVKAGYGIGSAFMQEATLYPKKKDDKNILGGETLYRDFIEPGIKKAFGATSLRRLSMTNSGGTDKRSMPAASAAEDSSKVTTRSIGNIFLPLAARKVSTFQTFEKLYIYYSLKKNCKRILNIH